MISWKNATWLTEAIKTSRQKSGWPLNDNLCSDARRLRPITGTICAICNMSHICRVQRRLFTLPSLTTPLLIASCFLRTMIALHHAAKLSFSSLPWNENRIAHAKMISGVWWVCHWLAYLARTGPFGNPPLVKSRFHSLGRFIQSLQSVGVVQPWQYARKTKP